MQDESEDDAMYGNEIEQLVRQIETIATERRETPAVVVQELLDFLTVFRRMRGNTVGHHMAFMGACAKTGQAGTLILNMPAGTKDLGTVSVMTDITGLIQLLK